MFTSSTPSNCFTVSVQSFWIVAFKGQAGVVSTTSKATVLPQIFTSLIIPRSTKDLCSSGSFTGRNASITASGVRPLVVGGL